ncbi:TetR/AcrR family transcriptional regulator [Nocardiopsis sp. NRRL B-16309]|uniref:TetR/AcrR family transcriptional regulator n=1 Tax=Nocardiopsis sp. NRRL B-16309 TaxID=1519494 RepID=UPI0006AFBA47|nr:TetR/AcrR family transcriptional regulator [Nocardiopsis sp. NRRL B-16309]KOX13944.1 TetR family transcriptional regulator [Nocardiopsis sp. NRRL B-16309]
MAGIRDRVRAEYVAEITEVARRHLAERGAAGLSVRAVTRELGMAASAVYRYFPNRDALLTALIVAAYEGAGEAAREAESAVDRHDHVGRWIAVFRAVRAWALAHPHEYALIYGSPVPGYAAPRDTTEPATRVVLLLTRIAHDARRGPGLAPTDRPPVPAELRADLVARIERIAADMDPERAAMLTGAPPETALAVIDGWTALFGTVGFELFGHYDNIIDAREAHLEQVARTTARTVGLPGA